MKSLPKYQIFLFKLLKSLPKYQIFLFKLLKSLPKCQIRGAALADADQVEIRQTSEIVATIIPARVFSVLFKLFLWSDVHRHLFQTTIKIVLKKFRQRHLSCRCPLSITIASFKNHLCLTFRLFRKLCFTFRQFRKWSFRLRIAWI